MFLSTSSLWFYCLLFSMFQDSYLSQLLVCSSRKFLNTSSFCFSSKLSIHWQLLALLQCSFWHFSITKWVETFVVESNDEILQIYSHIKETRRFFHPGSKRIKEFLLAKTMMAVVLLFLVFNIPRLILGIMEVVQIGTVELCYENGFEYDVGKEVYIVDIFARFLVILNSSVNFIIYCLVGSEFREELGKLLTLCERKINSSTLIKLIKENEGDIQVINNHVSVGD